MSLFNQKFSQEQFNQLEKKIKINAKILKKKKKSSDSFHHFLDEACSLVFNETVSYYQFRQKKPKIIEPQVIFKKDGQWLNFFKYSETLTKKFLTIFDNVKAVYLKVGATDQNFDSWNEDKVLNYQWDKEEILKHTKNEEYTILIITKKGEMTLTHFGQLLDINLQKLPK